MQNTLLILLSVLSFSCTSLTTRLFQTRLQRTEHAIRLFQAAYCLIAAACYFAVALANRVPFSTHILLPAAAFGCFFAAASLFSAKCMQLGYMSVSSIVVNLSLVLPVAFSWIVLKEPVELLSVIGLVLILVTLVLSSASTKGDSGNCLKKWLLFVSIAFFSNGGSAIVQKQYKAVWGEGDIMLFMAVAYGVSMLIFLTSYLATQLRRRTPLEEQISRPVLLPAIACAAGVGSFAGNGILGYLCDRVSGGVLYPCLNGGLSILVALASFVFFKEKLTRRKIAAICIGVFAIVLLNL